MTLTHAMHLDPLIAIFLAAAGFGIVFILYHVYELACLYWRGYRARKELHDYRYSDPGRPRLVARTHALGSLERRAADRRAFVQGQRAAEGSRSADASGPGIAESHGPARLSLFPSAQTACLSDESCYRTTSLTLGPKDGAA